MKPSNPPSRSRPSSLFLTLALGAGRVSSRRRARSAGAALLLGFAACNTPAATAPVEKTRAATGTTAASANSSSSAGSGAAAGASANISSAPASAGDELAKYKADLAERSQPADNIHEATSLRLGAWRFFYLNTVDHPREPAAVTASGQIVSMARRNDWHKLLSEKASTRELADRFSWLLGGAVVITDGSSLTDPQARSVIVPPVMKADGDNTLNLTMFVVRPPDTQQPSRLHVGAPPVGRGYFDDAGWRNVLGQ